MAQQSGRPYDDDLTVGSDEYNESFSTDYVDLFEPLGDVDSPIAKLKAIILSIDWEITDEILHQLNDELQDLKDVWAENKINLIYIQAMEKIGRYISSEKANSHPNAIKLLLTFYYDLEKIVSSATMSEEEKKQLLLQDVKKFDQFKIQIVPPVPREKKMAAVSPVAVQTQRATPAPAVPLSFPREPKNVLTNLKAIVLGIDWEISDAALLRLGEEVSRLEKVFSDSRAKLIFLQGIGAIGNYVRSTKSKAHPDAFKILHSFYHGLERIYNEVLSKTQEKEILLAEVKKFNAFKSVIAKVTSEVVVPVDEEEESAEEGGPFAPAFADMPDDVHGFRVDAEVVKGDIDKGVASFLAEKESVADQFAETVEEATGMVPEGPEVSSRLDALFGDEEGFEPIAATSEIALEGVDVETEADDDSDEKALPFQGGKLAPALAEAGGQSLYAEEIPVDKTPFKKIVAAAPVIPIPGVDVESEADDESEEAALPRASGGVAPALAFSDEEYGFREAALAPGPEEEEFDLEDRLDSFFGAEIEEASQGKSFQVSEDAHEKLMPVEVSPERVQEKEIKEERPAAAAAEAQRPLVSEPVAADLILEGADLGVSAEATVVDLEVVFEPVGDDVPVDELPQPTETLVTEGGIGLEQEVLAGLRESVSSISLHKYETAFPSFFAEIKSLRQGWQEQYIEKIFLQLLESVGQYIEQCRGAAEAESLILLQSLCDKLELVCQIKKGLDAGREQILLEETGKVLLWQQGLIAALLVKQGCKED